jgi:hypothetical protein
MPALSPALAGYPVHPLPILTASAAHLGRVRLRTHAGPTEMGGEAGPVVRALGWDTRRGRRPLDRLAACFAQPETERLLGQAVPPQAWHDEPAGRGLERLDDWGPLRLCTAGAVRAAPRCGGAHRAVPCAPTSRRVWGDEPGAETPARPWQGTEG